MTTDDTIRDAILLSFFMLSIVLFVFALVGWHLDRVYGALAFFMYAYLLAAAALVLK